MSSLTEQEQVARLIFSPQMIAVDGQLAPSAFPMDELLKKEGKTGVSIDRLSLIENPAKVLKVKASTLQNAEKSRSMYGYSIGGVSTIHGIADSNGGRAFKVVEDPLGDDGVQCWGPAHALIVKFDANHTRGLLRGARDKLVAAFANVVRFPA